MHADRPPGIFSVRPTERISGWRQDFGSARWSPDGKQIVFLMFTADRPRDGSEAIYAMSTDGSGLTSTSLSGESADWGAAAG